MFKWSRLECSNGLDFQCSNGLDSRVSVCNCLVHKLQSHQLSLVTTTEEGERGSTRERAHERERNACITRKEGERASTRAERARVSEFEHT